jgi:hypothetical protein
LPQSQRTQQLVERVAEPVRDCCYRRPQAVSVSMVGVRQVRSPVARAETSAALPQTLPDACAVAVRVPDTADGHPSRPQMAADSGMALDASVAMCAGYQSPGGRSFRKQRTVNPPIALVTTFSTLPQGRPCGRPPTAAVLGRLPHRPDQKQAAPCRSGRWLEEDARPRRSSLTPTPGRHRQVVRWLSAPGPPALGSGSVKHYPPSYV